MSIAGALGLLVLPTYARLARATTLQVSQEEFVLAARAYGCSPIRIIAREIAPNTQEVTLTLTVDHLEEMFPSARRRYSGCRVVRTPIGYPVNQLQYEREELKLVANAAAKVHG